MAQMLVITSAEELPQLILNLRAKGMSVEVPVESDYEGQGARVEVFVSTPDHLLQEAYEALADAA